MSMDSSLLSDKGEMYVPLPLSSLRELQYRYRPFDPWMEIRNISLHPGQATKVEIVTSETMAPTTKP